MNLWLELLFVWAVMAVVMTLAWLLQRRTNKAGIVDVFWSYGVGAAAAWLAWRADGLPERRALVAGVALFWCLRLGTMLLRRVSSHAEDGRYQRMKDHWGERAQRNLFFFFQAQAVWVPLFAIPCGIAARNAAPLGLLDGVGVAIGVLAIAGEGLADAQLAAYKREATAPGGVCRRGLWSWSRHPNYFFEWVFWWSWVAIGWSAPQGFVTLAGPVVMFLFLYRLTGIPYTEQQALASRGEAYRDYQQTVSAFFPLPPRRRTTS